jgi:hypothetical protein
VYDISLREDHVPPLQTCVDISLIDMMLWTLRRSAVIGGCSDAMQKLPVARTSI